MNYLKGSFFQFIIWLFFLHPVALYNILLNIKIFNTIGLQLYSKENPTQVFSCEHCEIFKNTYFEEHLQTNASATCNFETICNQKTFPNLQ